MSVRMYCSVKEFINWFTSVVYFLYAHFAIYTLVDVPVFGTSPSNGTCVLVKNNLPGSFMLFLIYIISFVFQFVAGCVGEIGSTKWIDYGLTAPIVMSLLTPDWDMHFPISVLTLTLMILCLVSEVLFRVDVQTGWCVHINAWVVTSAIVRLSGPWVAVFPAVQFLCLWYQYPLYEVIRGVGKKRAEFGGVEVLYLLVSFTFKSVVGYVVYKKSYGDYKF